MKKKAVGPNSWVCSFWLFLGTSGSGGGKCRLEFNVLEHVNSYESLLFINILEKNISDDCTF